MGMLTLIPTSIMYFRCLIHKVMFVPNFSGCGSSAHLYLAATRLKHM